MGGQRDPLLEKSGPLLQRIVHIWLRDFVRTAQTTSVPGTFWPA